MQVFGRLPLSHWQVVEQVVAAILRSGTGNFTFILGNKTEGILHQCQYVLWFQVAFHQQIIAGEAAHGTPIDNFVLPLRVIAQVGGGKMFDSMQSTLSQSRLAIGLFHTDVESSDCFSVHFILAGYVNAAQQADVVDCKTRNLLHEL